MSGTYNSAVTADRSTDLDLEKLWHPAQAFEDPQQVVGDPDLTLNEKRAILASWASDACAVEAAPALRCPPGLPGPSAWMRFSKLCARWIGMPIQLPCGHAGDGTWVGSEDVPLALARANRTSPARAFQPDRLPA
jgi:hypothetical protein